MSSNHWIHYLYWVVRFLPSRIDYAVSELGERYFQIHTVSLLCKYSTRKGVILIITPQYVHISYTNCFDHVRVCIVAVYAICYCCIYSMIEFGLLFFVLYTF